MSGVFRERLKRVPIVGPRLFHAYLAVRYGEGEVLTISAGPLKGKKFKRFIRTFWDGYVTGGFENDVLEAILREVGPGDRFFDIGANSGLMSMAAADAVGPSGHVVAFEPHPETASELRQQMEINGLAESVQVSELALSNDDATAEFSDDGPSDMLGLTAVGGQSARYTVTVRTARLDSIIDELGVPDAMKIDVEGADMWVLEGATRLLTDHRPLIFMELHTPEIAIEYREFMKRFGYTHSALDGSPIEGPITTRHVISRAAI